VDLQLKKTLAEYDVDLIEIMDLTDGRIVGFLRQ
jgi:hypothetical protein